MASEAAKAAAKWWGDRMRKPGVPDNGDRSEAGGMTAMLAVLTQRPVEADAVAKFEEALAAKIDESLTRGGSCYLGVDYHPGPILSECAEAAGVNPGMGGWPWKTSMHVDPESVRVAPGYRAEFQTIYPVAA